MNDLTLIKTVSVELRNEALGCGFSVLDKTILHTEPDRIIDEAFVLFIGEPAVELRVAIYLGHRCVLVHDADENTAAVCLIEVSDHSAGVLRLSGEGKMADDDALQHDGIVCIVLFVERMRAVRKERPGLLADHLGNGAAGNIEVIGGL